MCKNPLNQAGPRATVSAAKDAGAKATSTSAASYVLLTLSRMLLYVYLMIVHYPQTLFRALKQVVVEWKTFGGVPSKMFAAYNPHVGYKAGAFYSCQVVFSKRFTDPARLEQHFKDLAQEVGIEQEAAHIEFKEAPLNHPVSTSTPACIPSDYYVGAPGSNYKKDAASYKQFKIALVVCQDSSSPSVDSNNGCVIQGQLPGGTWDGTSCFNFMKELVARYYGDSPNYSVSKGRELTKLSPKAVEKFDSPLHVAYFLARMPYGIWQNESCVRWNEASTRVGIPYHKEEEREMALMNMSVEESKALAAACKGRKEKIAPTAALMYAGVTAYKAVTGEYPHCVPIQASLQTRACHPVFKERAFIGDWLVGPLHYVRSTRQEIARGLRHLFGQPQSDASDFYYTLGDAQRAYDKLLQELEGCDGAVRRAFHARVFGVKKGGAAQFEKAPEYADDNCLGASFFFNNYGRRNFHPEAGCTAWNWSGPGYIGCNCVLMNDQISACFASQHLGIQNITRVRNAAYEILQGIIKDADAR